SACKKNVCSGAIRPAPSNFVPLKVTDAGGPNACATGECAPGLTMMIVNTDSSSGAQLDSKVTCAADGAWKDESDIRHKYVMCNTLNCNTIKCPALVEGSGLDSGDVIPLMVTEGSGAVCATAKCPADEPFVQMEEDGSMGTIIDSASLKCIPG
ncbi:hypothetical protein PMAYCL1PPCAC_10800, partial [Pristionchus mayeri]